jgi:hypothetical protein
MNHAHATHESGKVENAINTAYCSSALVKVAKVRQEEFIA